VSASNASATSSVSASTSGACERIREVDGQSSAVSTNTATAAFTISASASLSSVATISATCIRRRKSSAAPSVTSVFAAIGREKWEPIGTDTQSWSTIPETSITWSDIAA